MDLKETLKQLVADNGTRELLVALITAIDSKRSLRAIPSPDYNALSTLQEQALLLLCELAEE